MLGPVRFGCSHIHPWSPLGQLTDTSRADGDPDPDGVLKEVVRIKIRHYRNVYLNRPDPIVYSHPTVVNRRIGGLDEPIHVHSCSYRTTPSLPSFLVSRVLEKVPLRGFGGKES